MRAKVKKQLEAYLRLKKQIRALEILTDIEGEQLLASMQEGDDDELEGSIGKVTLQKKMTTRYSDAFNERVGKLRVVEEKRGNVTYKEKPYLVARFPKEE